MSWSPHEPDAIMPLSDSRLELDGTAATLIQLWRCRDKIARVAADIARRDIGRLILVGSGDSFSVAQLISLQAEPLLSIPCRARQSFEFIQQADRLLTTDSLVIVISASGRASPTREALQTAVRSDACCVAVTNQPDSEFSGCADYALFTGAVKRGIPTQSTTAALLLLSLLAIELSFRRKTLSAEKREQSTAALAAMIEGLSRVQHDCRASWPSDELGIFFERQTVFLATGVAAPLANLASNLFACGPQLNASGFLLEEYHHSLRLFQANAAQLFVLFAPESATLPLAEQTAVALQQKGAIVLTLSPQSYAFEKAPRPLTLSNGCANFYHLLWLQELSLRLAQEFIQRGGRRASFNKG